MTASGSSCGPQVVKSLLAGMMSTMFWQDDNSEGDTVPEHCTWGSYFKTTMLRLSSPPEKSCQSGDSTVKLPPLVLDVAAYLYVALYRPEMASR